MQQVEPSSVDLAGSVSVGDPEAKGDLCALIADLRRELHAQRVALEALQVQVRQTESTLGQTRSELRLASAALMTAQEMERKRIASELHDSIGQSLNALSFGIGLAADLCRNGDGHNAAQMLEKLNAQVKDAVEEVRRIAINLRPAILDDLGIVGTLSWFFREFRAVQPCLVLHTEVEVEENDVPVALRTPIYRVVQEALNNIVKHAAARELRVVLTLRRPGIVLEIHDNGRGFSVAADGMLSGGLRAGMGLAGMRDRVEFSGGEFSLHSTSGVGTHIRAAWPLNAAAGGR